MSEMKPQNNQETTRNNGYLTLPAGAGNCCKSSVPWTQMRQEPDVGFAIEDLPF